MKSEIFSWSQLTNAFYNVNFSLSLYFNCTNNMLKLKKKWICLLISFRCFFQSCLDFPTLTIHTFFMDLWLLNSANYNQTQCLELYPCYPHSPVPCFTHKQLHNIYWLPILTGLKINWIIDSVIVFYLMYCDYLCHAPLESTISTALVDLFEVLIWTPRTLKTVFEYLCLKTTLSWERKKKDYKKCFIYWERKTWLMEQRWQRIDPSHHTHACKVPHNSLVPVSCLEEF